LYALKIPPESLSIFNRVAETYDGEAMSQVEQQDANSTTFSCGGCFMSLPAEVVNICPAKTRFFAVPIVPELYLKEEEE
jgi:predicted  nucleic acid-binding Zn-ribbon protein